MQTNLERGKAASGARGIGRFVGILAGVPLVAALALTAPEQALAACGASHPAGVHTGGGGGSVHTATSRPPTSGGGGGGGGSLGCPNGTSASASPSALRGLSTATSGRVVETGAHSAARTAAHPRTASTKTTRVSAHSRGVKAPRA